MEQDIILGAETVSMFCRLQMNVKRDIPIRPSEMGVLIFTCKQMNPVTPIMISQFFKIAKPSVTAMVNTLIKNGYLSKRTSSEDRRSYILSATEKGTSLVEETYHEYFKSMENLKQEMGVEEFHNLVNLLQTANEILTKGRN